MKHLKLFENFNQNVFYHGSNEKNIKSFKIKKGTFLDPEYDNPIFLTTDKEFANYYGKYVYEIHLSNDVNIFDYRQLEDIWNINELSYGYKLYNDLYSGNYDNLFLPKYKNDDEPYDELYNNIQFGDYSTIEDVWFYEWLKNNSYHGAYITETKTLNLLIFNNEKVNKIVELY